jgi:hypothetical protein
MQKGVHAMANVRLAIALGALFFVVGSSANADVVYTFQADPFTSNLTGSFAVTDSAYFNQTITTSDITAFSFTAPNPVFVFSNSTSSLIVDNGPILLNNSGDLIPNEAQLVITSLSSLDSLTLTLTGFNVNDVSWLQVASSEGGATGTGTFTHVPPLSAAPEPSSFLFLASGGAVLLGWRRLRAVTPAETGPVV